MEKKTPLYEAHLEAKGKIVPFAGYLLPVQYEGVIAEHMAVRKNCGLFDVSHMGEVICEGEDALANLNYLLTNEFKDLRDGQARYSPMCTEEGGVVDDLIVYKIHPSRYLIVVNAANKEKDFAWMQSHAFGRVNFEDISERVAQIALQGPKSGNVLRKLVKAEELPKKYYTAKFDCRIQGISCVISKTGYTGEDGYEFYLEAKDAKRLWKLLLEAGQEEGLIPCGLGARDTLRLEAAMPLYGHEMNEEVTPFEAGLGTFVKMQKADFIGKRALEEKKDCARRRVGLKVIGKGIVRENMELYVEEQKVGITTSGTHCPYLGYPVAMALVSEEYQRPGTQLEAVVRGRRVQAEVVKLPFYRRSEN